MDIKDRNIVLAVCGGIAAYKSVELLRLLIKQGASVRVAMTESACAFVSPLTFEALSGQRVLLDLFDEEDASSMQHIEWADQAEAVIVAPATANIIGKLANGIADDAVSTFMLAVTGTKLICPSMNTHMYENQAVQRNLDTLESDGYVVLEPGTGELACGTSGAGRMPEPEIVFDRLLSTLSPKNMTGVKVLVTAGPTQEPIDPVRFISNHSSGKMGYALARSAEYRGAQVTLVSGPVDLMPPENVELVNVQTAEEMTEAVFSRLDASDLVVKVAAVGDYRVANLAEQKIKKESAGDVSLSLVENQDILKEIGRRKKHQVVVGFAAETENLEENAQAKLRAKNLDMIAVNQVAGPLSAFGNDTNEVQLFFKDGTSETLARQDKAAVADVILDRAVALTGQGTA